MFFKTPALRAFGYSGFIGKTLAKLLPDTPWATYLLSFRVFKRTYGFRPRLRSPRTLNEWLFARKVTLPKEISFAPWVDKQLVKDSVAAAMKGAPEQCHIAKTLHCTQDAADPWFDAVLPRCVIKGTHGSGMTILVREPRRLTDEERGELRRWMAAEYFQGSREPSYRHLKPGIIVEEFLPCDRLVPEDYKFFCFRGRIAFIQHDTGRFIEHRRCLYTKDWLRLPVRLQHVGYDHEAPPPRDLVTMVAIAQRLSKEQNFVRVDLYQTEAGVYFGEMTFFPGSGLEIFDPPAFDAELCRRWLQPSSSDPEAAETSLPIGSCA